jgi:hypothetical protein
MIKELPVMTKFIVCDLCGSVESSNLNMHRCQICGKDACEACVSDEAIIGSETLCLCTECDVKFDLTAYRKVHEEINTLREQLSDKYTEAHIILVAMKNETKSN